MEYLRLDSTRTGWARGVEACSSLSSSSEDLVTGQRNLGWGAVGVFQGGGLFPDVRSVNLALFFCRICCLDLLDFPLT